MKKVLIVGFGSIGQRHYKNFTKQGADVSILSRRPLSGPERSFADLKSAFDFGTFDTVFICNETSMHANTLTELVELRFKGQVIIEKPVFDLNFKDFKIAKNLNVRVSYNLRFYSPLMKLKNELQQQKIISSHVYVGQYLPTWRPSQDYRKSYSAFSEKGGGVLLDLSHELDYCSWLFGEAKGLFSLNGKFSDLEINSMDTCGLLIQYKNCSMATVQLNYLDRITQRLLIINTNENTYKLDFIGGSLIKNSEVIYSYNKLEDEDSYTLMTKDILFNQARGLTTYDEAVGLMQVMQNCVVSSHEKIWMNL